MTPPAFVHRFVRGTSPTTLLLLHGTGGDEADLLPLGHAVAPGASLLSPRGQVLEHGMARFFRRFDTSVFDEEDIVRRANDLRTFVETAARDYRLDAARVVALGYSNGANMAASLLLLHPALLAGAALLRAVLPLVPPAPPALTGTPVLISAGRQDPYAPEARVLGLSAALSSAGARVDLRWYGGGHELAPDESALLREWWDREVEGRR